MLDPHSHKVLFHRALVVMENDKIYDAKRCDKMGPNIYRIEGQFYRRDGTPRPVNPNAPAIASIVTSLQATMHMLLDPGEVYGAQGSGNRYPQYDFKEQYSKKA